MNLMVKDNQIINIEELKKIIETENLTEEMLKNALNLLVNNEEFKVLENKDELISLLNQKLTQKSEKTNKESLEDLKQINSNFNNLSIVNTYKEKNDSEKDIDYLILKDDNDNIKGIISFRFQNKVNTFIQTHPEVTTWDSERLFNHFASEVESQMRFEDIENIENDFHKDSVTRENDYIVQEKEEVEKFARDYEITDRIKVGIDYQGERIYQVGPAVIKFYTTPDKKRKMEFLSKPDFVKKENDYNLMIESLDNSSTAIEEDEINEVEEIDSDDLQNNMVQETESIEYKDVDFEEEFGRFTLESLEKANKYFEKRNVYYEELTSEEYHFLYSVFRKLVDDMPKVSSNPTEYESLTGISYKSYMAYLDSYVKPYIDKYNLIKEGIVEENELSKFVIETLDIYYDNLDYVKQKKPLTEDKVKKLVRIPEEGALLVVLLAIILVIFAVVILVI